MCGITGWIDWKQDLTKQSSIIEAMTEPLACRGPDASATWLSHRAAFGHRRLIVVDPEGGAQPMHRQSGDKKYVIAYNGELYNTAELQQELRARGHHLRSHSDTEALLLSYIEWGEACVERFNGIFAFAIWNEAEQSLFLGRDRIGVKPLFFAKRGSAFLFASELKSLLAHPAVKPEITKDGLAEIFAMGPSRTPGHGVFHEVEELRPGFCMTVTPNGIRKHQYWMLKSQPHEDDLETTTLKVRELFEDAVERQLVSDVPVCTLLSGGLDSSAITAFAARHYAREGKGLLHSYSVDYVDNDKHFKQNEFQPNTDAPWAKRVSEYLGTVPHNIQIDTPQLVDALTAAVRARDLPGMADVDASLLLFCQEIKKESTVALSGECADEVFGGYPWFHREEDVNAGTFPWMRRNQERYQFYSTDLFNEIRPDEYKAARYQEALDEVPRLVTDDSKEARMREMFYLNLTRWMPTLLDRKDRMSMAVGLEVRVPFCDHRLVEYVWNIPWEIKNYGNMPKGILRRALQGILPDDVLNRKKSPYPKTHNPAYLAATRQWILEILHDSSSPILPFVNKEHIVNFANSDLKNIHLPWFSQLMNVPQLFAYLAQIDTWMREYHVTVK